jgi:hypothetical protein
VTPLTRKPRCLATTAGAIPVDRLVTLGSIAAVLGGIVAAGANAPTLRQANADKRAAAARRAEPIGGLPFSTVFEQTNQP